MHQKCSNYALTNLLFGLCKFEWIIDPFITCPSPHPGTPTCLITPKVLWVRECTSTFYPSAIFTFGFTIESIKELEGSSSMPQKMCRNQNIFSWVMMNSTPLTIKVGCMFMFMWQKKWKRLPILLNLQRMIDGSIINNLTFLIIQSLVEYGGLNEVNIAMKLIYFGANEVTIFHGVTIQFM